MEWIQVRFQRYMVYSERLNRFFRASPLIQIDRLLSRIDLFCRLHRLVHYEKKDDTLIPLPSGSDSPVLVADASMPMIFWNDLL